MGLYLINSRRGYDMDIIYDVECYENRICVGTLFGKDNIHIFDGIDQIRRIPFRSGKHRFIGFNNRRYDHLIIDAILNNKDITLSEIYALSKKIINSPFGSMVPSFDKNIIDTLEICPPPIRCSLKEFGHRMKYRMLENLPYPYDKELTDKKWEHVKKYNIHDLKITQRLWNNLKSSYEARMSLKQYFNVATEFGGTPGLAEKCILSKFTDKDRIDEKFELVKQDNLKLSDDFREIYDYIFALPLQIITNKKQKKKLKYLKESDKPRNANGCYVKLGFGGLHGISGPGVYRDVYDYDVTSYYPSIILQCKLGSPKFRYIYEEIYNNRLRLKKKGDKSADGLKLVLNSLYGKLLADGEYRKEQIFAPAIGLSICFLGQYYLIDLIEKLEYGQCLCANTDGIICNKEIPNQIIREWEGRTGFKLTKKKYKHFVLKDVNSYYAETYDGKIKRKKDFVEPSFDKISNGNIIQRSIINYIYKQKDIMSTLMEEKDLYNFCYFKKIANERDLLLKGKIQLGGEILQDPKIRCYVSNKGKKLISITRKERCGFFLSDEVEGNRPVLKSLTKPKKYKESEELELLVKTLKLASNDKVICKFLKDDDGKTHIFYYFKEVESMSNKLKEIIVEAGYNPRKIIVESKTRKFKGRVVTLAMNLDKKVEGCDIDYEYYEEEAHKILEVLRLLI